MSAAKKRRVSASHISWTGPALPSVIWAPDNCVSREWEKQTMAAAIFSLLGKSLQSANEAGGFIGTLCLSLSCTFAWWQEWHSFQWAEGSEWTIEYSETHRTLQSFYVYYGGTASHGVSPACFQCHGHWGYDHHAFWSHFKRYHPQPPFSPYKISEVSMCLQLLVPSSCCHLSGT